MHIIYYAYDAYCGGFRGVPDRQKSGVRNEEFEDERLHCGAQIDVYSNLSARLSVLSFRWNSRFVA